jgi:hypothetical protein
MSSIKQFPHCDSSVLHAPGVCEYCDAHPDWQELRETWKIAFTGKPEEGKLPDPASLNRPTEVINRWPGNRPKTEEKPEYIACPVCPHWMHIHENGRCGSGCCACNEPSYKPPLPGDLTKLAAVPPVDRSAVTTLHGTTVEEVRKMDPEKGMLDDYIVLTEEERKKGFKRPVRRSYTHKKCGRSTHMGLALCETYARDPTFYNATYCATCGTHSPVGPDGEFTWDEDGEKVGT